MTTNRSIIVAIIAAILGVGLGLLLTPGGGDEHAEHAATSEENGAVYSCSMHPQIRSETPGQCPICGMDLVPVTQGESTTSPTRVELSDRAKKLAQIRTVEVKKLGDLGARIELLGRIEQDETGIRTVTAWTAGRLDRLHVATTGQTVRAGQTIATIYSPEIYTAHRDLLQAKRQLANLASGMGFAQKSAEATLEASRQKLRLLGVSNGQISSMEQADAPWTQVKIRTRFGGTVVERLVNEGAYVQAGTGLYRVADLSKLWVQLDAYESDLPRLRVGQHVSLTVEARPGELFDGTVAFIDPVVDPVKRTARVRVEVSNDGDLRPGMFVSATVAGGRETGEEAPLVIPNTAPLFLGRRSVVYVEDGAAYEAREVTLGPRAGDVYPVLSGLEAGERVVVHGAFAIDADLQIRGGNSMMMKADDTMRAETLTVSDDFRTGLAPLISHYLDMQTALADDDLAAARKAAEALGRAAENFSPALPANVAEVWLSLRNSLKDHAGQFDQAADLAAARDAFRGISSAVSRLLQRFGNPTDTELHVAYCPMAFENEGAEWIQAGATVDNSYFGASMLRCGEIRETIAPAPGAEVPDE